MAQQLRKATPFGTAPKYVIRDHDAKFGTAFDRVAAGANITILTTCCARCDQNSGCNAKALPEPPGRAFLCAP